jgi:hypothetical protein
VAATALAAGGAALIVHYNRPEVKPAPVVEAAPPREPHHRLARPFVPEPEPPVVPPAPVVEATGELMLQTHPHGAILYLDGKRLEALSNTTITAAAGREHTLIIEKHGFQSAQRKFAVDAQGRQRLVVSLPAVSAHAAPAAPPPPAPPVAPVVMKGPGILALTSSPWCTVSIDGSERGQTPMKLEVAAGTHQVVLINPEYHIKRQISVTVHPGETIRKSLEFTR